MIRERRGVWLTSKYPSCFVLLAAGFSFVFFGAVAQAATTTPSCGWQYSSLLTNTAWPDSNAEYWITPFTSQSDLTISVHGRFPNARYFSFTAYDATGTARPSNEIHDTQITRAADGTFTVTVRHSPGSNAIQFVNAPNGTTGYLIFRVFLPKASVQLPSLTYISNAGKVNLRPCSSYKAPSNVTGIFNNPDISYVELFPPAASSDTVTVISGKAPTEVRYWSVCSYSWNTAVVDCRYDGNTVLTGGYYHIVLALPAQKPAVLSGGYTYLQYARMVTLRDLLGHQIRGDYAPVMKTCSVEDRSCIEG
jgi:hypothetical protein